VQKELKTKRNALTVETAQRMTCNMSMQITWQSETTRYDTITGNKVKISCVTLIHNRKMKEFAIVHGVQCNKQCDVQPFIRCSFNFFVAVRTVSDSATVAALHHHHHNYHSLNAILHYSSFYEDFWLC
jgi:hypothetical protein